MADPCSQEKTIGEMQATMDAISDSLKDMRDGQKRFMILLEDIARQGEQIRSVVHRTDKHEKDLDGLFKRMRDVELAPGKQASATQTYGIMTVISVGVGYLFKKFGG